jgi:hypothetical protein
MFFMFVQHKIPLLLARFIVSVAFVGIGATVALANGPRKFDEFSKLSCAHELIRLDNFGAQLRAEPNALGVVIVYGARSGTKRGEVVARLFAIRDALVRRKNVDTHRIVILDGGFRAHFAVELWWIPLEGRESVEYLITVDVSPGTARVRGQALSTWRYKCDGTAR